MILNILGSWLEKRIFWLAENMRAVIRNVREIITKDRRSIKIWEDRNDSPLEGIIKREKDVSHKKDKELEFHKDFGDHE